MTSERGVSFLLRISNIHCCISHQASRIVESISSHIFSFMMYRIVYRRTFDYYSGRDLLQRTYCYIYAYSHQKYPPFPTSILNLAVI